MTNLYDPKTDTGVGVVYGQDGNNAQGKVISGQRQDPPTKTRTITPHSGSAELREAGVNSYADTLDVHEVGKHLADGTTGEVDRNGNVTV